MELFRKIDLYLDIFSPRGTHGSIKGRTMITRLVEEAKRDTNIVDMPECWGYLRK